MRPLAMACYDNVSERAQFDAGFVDLLRRAHPLGSSHVRALARAVGRYL